MTGLAIACLAVSLLVVFGRVLFHNQQFAFRGIVPDGPLRRRRGLACLAPIPFDQFGEHDRLPSTSTERDINDDQA